LYPNQSSAINGRAYVGKNVTQAAIIEDFKQAGWQRDDDEVIIYYNQIRHRSVYNSKPQIFTSCVQRLYFKLREIVLSKLAKSRHLPKRKVPTYLI
jgi:hypothetical protein